MRRIMIICGLVVISIASAHAISEKYRSELEHTLAKQIQDADVYHSDSTKIYRGLGLNVERCGDQVYIDGKVAEFDGRTPSSEIFIAGTKQIIFYKKGHVSVIDNGRYIGELKLAFT